MPLQRLVLERPRHSHSQCSKPMAVHMRQSVVPPRNLFFEHWLNFCQVAQVRFFGCPIWDPLLPCLRRHKVWDSSWRAKQLGLFYLPSRPFLPNFLCVLNDPKLHTLHPKLSIDEETPLRYRLRLFPKNNLAPPIQTSFRNLPLNIPNIKKADRPLSPDFRAGF